MRAILARWTFGISVHLDPEMDTSEQATVTPRDRNKRRRCSSRSNKELLIVDPMCPRILRLSTTSLFRKISTQRGARSMCPMVERSFFSAHNHPIYLVIQQLNFTEWLHFCDHS